MSDYISREAAQKIICGWCGVCQNPTLHDLMHCDDICPQFAQIHAADVRPVVLCRDCRHRDPEDRKCDSGEMERQGCPFKVADNYFCAYGER